MTGIGHWHWHGFGFFTLTLKSDLATAVGRVGVLKHVDWPREELAWHLFDNGTGKGFATEAATAVRDWAGKSLGLGKLVSFIDRQNVKSQAVAQRLGAITHGVAPAHDAGAEIWHHAEVQP